MTQSVLILGLGKSGKAAACHALARKDDVTIYAGKSNDAAYACAAQFEKEGATVFFDTEDVQGSFDICIVSPGIPQTGSFYQSALQASNELMSEPEYAWRYSPENWIAVTGTNGKTTTTSLIAHLLNACGHAAQSCGNIGRTCLEAAESRSADETLVAEMSSFQLASTCRFAPCVGVLLNITPDHIAWHGGFNAYAQAKFKVFDNMGAGTSAVITDEVLAAYPELSDRLTAQGVSLVHVGKRFDHSCAFVNDDNVLVYIGDDGAPVELVAAHDLKIKGSHNIENSLAAAAAVLAYGCKPECVCAGLKSFEPLEHRIEPCGTVAGIEFFNDSKATNVDATLKALTAFPATRIVLLLGGRDKGTALEELVSACQGVCAAIVAYGEAGQRFYDAFADSGILHDLQPGMRQAFERAREIAQPGQAIVLSPACASFDEFDSFEQRGEVFKEYVVQAAKAQG